MNYTRYPARAHGVMAVMFFVEHALMVRLKWWGRRSAALFALGGDFRPGRRENGHFREFGVLGAHGPAARRLQPLTRRAMAWTFA